MEWHINDLSIEGQYGDPAQFRAALEPILQLRTRRPELRGRLYCSRMLYLRKATSSLTVQQAIVSIGDPNFRRLALEWFANGGPFWDDSRAATQDDLFYLGGIDVTDQGLGEAARRILGGVGASSFTLPETSFESTPLRLDHGLPEDPLGVVQVPNFWRTLDVEAYAFDPVASWSSMWEWVRGNLEHLVLPADLPPRLRAAPFHLGVAERTLQLLRILNDIATETLDDSALTPLGLEIYQKHFVGGKASFTDESDSNKNSFQTEMTFRDPSDIGEKLFCPWHGKVKIGQFRIHFEWQRPKGQREIKVVYIGPKITTN
jgi:hypothetical protein